MVALGLTLVLGIQLLWGGASLILSGPPEPRMPAPDSLGPVWLELPPYGVASNEIVERPLYWKGRQKKLPGSAPAAQKPAAKPKAQRDELDQVALLGVFSGGESPGIIVKFKKDRQRITLGGEVAGWTLAGLEEMAHCLRRVPTPAH